MDKLPRIDDDNLHHTRSVSCQHQMSFLSTAVSFGSTGDFYTNVSFADLGTWTGVDGGGEGGGMAGNPSNCHPCQQINLEIDILSKPGQIVS